MIESGDAHEVDYSIQASATVFSVQWTKKDDGSLEAFYQTINSNKLSWWALNKITIACAIISTYIGSLCKP